MLCRDHGWNHSTGRGVEEEVEHGQEGLTCRNGVDDKVGSSILCTI